MPPDFVYALPPAGMFLVILLGVGLIAVAFHILLFWQPLRRMLSGVVDLSPAVMTLCGTLFGLSVTFLANSVWLTEDRGRETVNAEARSLRVMEVYVGGLTAPAQDGFTHLIASYGQAVAAEWPSMAKAGPHPDAEQQLRDIYAAVLKGFAEGDQNRAVQQRMLAALDGLSTARQQRLTMAQDVVSAGQWFLVSGLGFLLLAIVAIGHARAPQSRAVALSAMTAAITVALFVIVSHDRPFVGYMALTPHPILSAAGVAD